MRKLLTCCIGIAAIATATVAHAYPTLVGPTGAGNLPTAAVAPAGQLDIAADFDNTKNSGLGIKNAYPVRVLYGITRDWEIGGGYRFNKVNDVDANTWNANVKYIVPLSLAGFTWSLGGLYARTQQTALPFTATKDITGEQAYIVGDYTFPLGKSTTLTGTVGVNWTRIDTGANKASQFRYYGAANLGLTKQISLVADVQSKNTSLGDATSLFSAALRYAPSSTISGEAGISNGALNGLLAEPRGRFFAGVNFTFGGPSGTSTTSTTSTGY